MSRPRVAVSVPTRGGRVAWWLIALRVFRAGGRPVLMRPDRPKRSFDALVLSGGGDIATGDVVNDIERAWSRRDGTVLEATLMLLRRAFARRAADEAPNDAQRDRFELDLLAEAREQGRPVLGICRGAQLINIAARGTLVDVHVLTGEESILHTAFPHKTVSITPGSRLARLVGRPTLSVNALHHQTIDRLGEGLEVVATDPEGLVQAIEARRGWVLGVQWHPEFLMRSAAQSRIFEGLVGRARRHDSH